LVDKNGEDNEELSFVFEYASEGNNSRRASNNSGALELMTFGDSESHDISNNNTLLMNSTPNKD